MPIIVSADLAYRKYRDTGVAVLQASEQSIECTFVNLPSAGLAGEPAPDVLAEFLAGFCLEIGATVMLLDGPQGWKDPDNGLEHSRLCERALHTPAKTGIPGVVKPGNYLPFVAFAIAVFDALAERGWSRYTGDPLSNRNTTAVESFPMSAWKSLGLSMLPAKAKCRDHELSACLDGLCALVPLHLLSKPNHDEVQALVRGLPALDSSVHGSLEQSRAGSHLSSLRESGGRGSLSIHECYR